MKRERYSDRADRLIEKIRQEREEERFTRHRERFLIIALAWILVALILAGILLWVTTNQQLPGAIAPCNLGNFRYCGCDGFFCWP